MMSAVIQYLLRAFKHAADGAIAFGNLMRNLLGSGLYIFFGTLYKSLMQNSISMAHNAFSSSTNLFLNAFSFLKKTINTSLTFLIALLLRSISFLKNLFGTLRDIATYFAALPLKFLNQMLQALKNTYTFLKYLALNGLFYAKNGLSYLFNTIGHSSSSLLKNMQQGIDFLVSTLISIISRMVSRTLQSMLEIGLSLKKTFYFAADLLTKIAAWTLFKILGGISNLLDATTACVSAINKSLHSCTYFIINIPTFLGHQALSVYRTTNTLFSNLMVYLLEREWALVGALRKIILQSLMFIKNSFLLIFEQVLSSIQWIIFDIPLSILRISEHYLNALVYSAQSLLWGITPRLQRVHVATKTVLSGTAGFLFLEIPRGATQAGLHFFYKISDGFLCLGSLLRKVFERTASRIYILLKNIKNVTSRCARSIFIDIPLIFYFEIKYLFYTSAHLALRAYAWFKSGILISGTFLFGTVPTFLWANISKTLFSIAITVWSALVFLSSKIQKAYTYFAYYFQKIARVVFIEIPLNLWHGIRHAGKIWLRGALFAGSSLKKVIGTISFFLFLTIPKTVWSGILSATKTTGSGLQKTHSIVSPKLQIAHTITKKALIGTAGFMFLEIPQGLFQYLKMTFWVLKDAFITILLGLKAVFLWTGWALFIQIPRALFFSTKAVLSLFFKGISSALIQLQKIIRWSALFVITFITAINKGLKLIGVGSRIVLDGILGIPRGIANMVVETAHMVLCVFIAIKSLFKKIWDGICYLAATPSRAVKSCIEIIIFKIHRLHVHTISTIYAQRSIIQSHAFLAASIYIFLVLFATYNIHHNAPIIRATTTNKNIHPHAIPVNVDLEIHKLQPSSDGFGCIDIEGILTYSYNTGTEPAHSIDNFSIKNVVHHTLKKLGSSVDHNHITTTRHAITATLSPALSNASTFPFSGSQSSFTIQNNSLSSREIHYMAPHKLLSPGNETLLGLQKILMEPGESSLNARSKSVLMPELTITLEYQRWESYVILGLYITLFAIILLAIASILIPAQSIRITVSGISFCILGIAWIACYLGGMLTNVNHLMITLLLGLALSAIIVALNASTFMVSPTYQDNEYYQSGSREGQTRWILFLLSTLALVLTMLIKL